MAITHALLLAAGLGTRLQPLTAVRAKPAMPVAGEPLVRRIIRWLAAAGVHDIVINLHHLPETITRVVGDGADLDVRVRYSWEQPAVLGSAGGPRQALDIVGADRFLVVNGDTLTDVDIRAVEAAHAARGALVTMAVVPNAAPHHYGGLIADDDHRVTRVAPKGSSAGSWHFIGVQVVESAAFRDVPRGQVLNSVGGTYDLLWNRQPGSVRVLPCSAAFMDIGTVADYWATSRALERVNDDATRRPPFDTPSAAAGRPPDAAGQSAVSRRAEVVDSIIWDDVSIGTGAVVERCIVTDGVQVASGTRHRDAILIRATDGSTMSVPLAGRL